MHQQRGSKVGDVLIAVSAPHPCLVLHQRSAHVAADFPVVIGLIGNQKMLRNQSRINVVRLQRIVVKVTRC